MAHRRAANRGSAVLEFALVLPLLIALILYSLFFTELIGAKLKLLEVIRYAAWELSSHPLSDYGTGHPRRAFERAAARTVRQAEAQYGSLDSVERGSGDFLARLEHLEVRIAESEVPWIEAQGLSAGLSGDEWSGAIFGALASGPAQVLRAWGFNTAGKLRIEASASLRNRLLPHRFLDHPERGFFHVDFFGGADLARIPLRSGLTLIADGWTLPDGADSMMKGSQSGRHRESDRPSGLYRQVRRMGFLGVREQLERLPVLSSALGLIQSAAPNPVGTYVVSHNYAPSPEGVYRRDCNNPEYPANAAGGLNNLAKFSQLDNDRPRCFDTAPFRDQASYADSLYVRIFAARGNWFMGCNNAQADDPSSGGQTQLGGETSGGCE